MAGVIREYAGHQRFSENLSRSTKKKTARIFTAFYRRNFVKILLV